MNNSFKVVLLFSSFQKGYSQTSLTDELVQEVCEMSSGIELAKAIPAIEQPLTYHLLFAGSDGLLPEMTYEDISGHHSYQLDNIQSNLEYVRLAIVLCVLALLTNLIVLLQLLIFLFCCIILSCGLYSSILWMCTPKESSEGI